VAVCHPPCIAQGGHQCRVFLQARPAATRTPASSHVRCRDGKDGKHRARQAAAVRAGSGQRSAGLRGAR
jgi:hypothetical protein